jgi:AsmA protein
LLKVSALAASEPVPTQAAAQAAASSSPFWSALRASGEIEVQQFGIFKLNAGPIELKPRLQNLHLTTDFSAPDFYAGRIGGYLELTPIGTKAPALKLLAKGEGVQIGPLLSDLRTELSASGAAEIGLELTATGGDWAQISHSLGGDAALLLRDVRVEGIALDKLLRAKGLNLPATLAELPQLDVFTEMSASFQGGSGLFRSQDILARSPQVAISGTGLVELPTQRVDFDLNAVLQPKANEPDGIDLSGLELPLRIQGGWTAPRVTLDPGPALREAAARALERKLQQHQGKLRALEEQTGIKGLEQGLRQLLGTD